jgi:hypothetical protein
MKNASQILEAKGYEGHEVDSIINWANGDNESLDIQTRIEFGIQDEPVHLWEAYYVGDSDEKTLNEIAKSKGYYDHDELLDAATRHLNSLAESYPSK